MANEESLSNCLNYFKSHFPNYIDIGEQFDQLILKNITPKSIVVDIGCGRHSRLANHKQNFKKLIGIDISQKELNYNQALDEKVVSDAGRKIPLENSSIDLVISFFALEHISNPRHCLAEVERILKPGGKFIFLTPNLLYPTSLLNKLLPWQNFKKRVLEKIAKRRPESVFPVYYRLNSLFSVNRLRRENLFKTVTLLYLGGPFDLHFSFTLFKLATYYEKFLTSTNLNFLLPHLIIIGEK